jgi:hypothetical protein
MSRPMSAEWARQKLLAQHVEAVRGRISCTHCGTKQRRCPPTRGHGRGRHYVVLHHPNGDGHLGRVDDLVRANAAIEQSMLRLQDVFRSVVPVIQKSTFE